MAKSIGEQVGNYRLIRLLGHGGFADVYLGEHVYLHTQAAIKILHTQIEEEHVETFLREALLIAHLVHPHIVRVLDFNVENGVPFLVMDYAPNGNLRQRYPKGSRLPSASIASYVKQVASALQYAHDRNLIHRDVKPANMLLGYNNEVLLSDFGIALVSENSLSQKTEEEIVGTLAYMAPEQLNGKARPASDQYALAAVVYEWITGRRLFNGSQFEIMAQHFSDSPPSLSEYVDTLPPAVEHVVQRALAKDPHQRFPRVQDFADALERAYQTPVPQPTISRPANVATKGMSQPPAETVERSQLQSTDRSTTSQQPELTPPLVLPSPPKEAGLPASSAAQVQTSPALAPAISHTVPGQVKKGFRILTRGLALLLVLVVLGAGALCWFGFTAFNTFFHSNSSPSLSQTEINRASTVANGFVVAISRQNYSQAYAALGASLKGQISGQEFIQQARDEDNCAGVITHVSRLENATTIQGSKITYTYEIKRAKITKPYRLYATLQQDSSNNWHIVDYNSNIASVQPGC
jgi:serine/threonine protein kinase